MYLKEGMSINRRNFKVNKMWPTYLLKSDTDIVFNS